VKNLMKRGGVPDLLSPDTSLTPRGFLRRQHFVTNGAAVEAVAASVERRRASQGNRITPARVTQLTVSRRQIS
jgi:hypothetical protein